MARLHPHLPNQGPMSGGDYRERDLLWLLRDGLPDSFDVFHGLTWSAMHGAFQQFGELDLTIVSPLGHLLVLEVKAGKVFTQEGKLLKSYGRDGPKDVGHQVRRQYGPLRSLLAAAGLADVYVDTLLVLPDHAVIEGTLAYPRERIIDATEMARFCSLLQAAFSPTTLGPPDRERLIDFLSNRFGVAPNVDAHIGQIQRLSTQLSLDNSCFISFNFPVNRRHDHRQHGLCDSLHHWNDDRVPELLVSTGIGDWYLEGVWKTHQSSTFARR